MLQIHINSPKTKSVGLCTRHHKLSKFKGKLVPFTTTCKKHERINAKYIEKITSRISLETMIIKIIKTEN